MSYYITAHRHGAKINMPVEEKHKYITDSAFPLDSGADIAGYSQKMSPGATAQYAINTLSVYKVNYSTVIEGTGSASTPIGSSKSLSGLVKGLNLTEDQIQLFYRPAQLAIEQGTGSRQRIGDKVFLKNVNIMLNLCADQEWMKIFAPHKKVENTQQATFRPASYTGNSAGGTITSTESDATFYNQINWRQNIRQWAKFRIMLVRFNDLTDNQATQESYLKEYIRDWFNTIFVPSMIIPNATFSSGSPTYKDINVLSNQSKMLRESTEFNGKYQILYDEMVELGQNDMNKHITINLNPKMNLTFDNDNHPTSEKYNDVFGFIIPPVFYKMDMDTCTYQAIQTTNESGNAFDMAHFTTNIKFTYYDI